MTTSGTPELDGAYFEEGKTVFRIRAEVADDDESSYSIKKGTVVSARHRNGAERAAPLVSLWHDWDRELASPNNIRSRHAVDGIDLYTEGDILGAMMDMVSQGGNDALRDASVEQVLRDPTYSQEIASALIGTTIMEALFDESFEARPGD